MLLIHIYYPFNYCILYHSNSYIESLSNKKYTINPPFLGNVYFIEYNYLLGRL